MEFALDHRRHRPQLDWFETGLDPTEGEGERARDQYPAIGLRRVEGPQHRSQRRSMGGADSMGAVGVVFEDLFEDLFEVVDDQQQRLVPGPGLRAVPRSVVRRQTSHSPAALLPEALAFHLGRIRPRHIQDGTATH
jgi:hypothetical protein